MERCLSCQFYDRNAPSGVGEKSSRAGQCRRHAPKLSPVAPKSYVIEGVWPTVRDEDWCGEWKLGARRTSDTSRSDALLGAIGAATSTVPRVGESASAPKSIGAIRAGDD